MPCLAATSLTATPSARRQVPKVRRRSCELIRRKTSYGLSSSGAGSQRKNAITDAIARVAVMQVASDNQSAGVPPAFALVGWDSCTCTGAPSAAGVPLTITR